MSYLDEGEGETVLMLHGNPSWSFYYRELVKALRPSHRCLVPDHVGMGLSDKPGEDRYPYTLKSRVDDLDAFMAKIAPRGPVTLILHDWGGMIGMSWAVRHPERIKAIAAFNTACFRLPSERGLPTLLKLIRNQPTGFLLRASRAARKFLLDTCTTKRRMPPAASEAYLSVCDGWRESLAVHRFVQDIPLSPADPAWSVVTETESKLELFKNTPMLLPWGMKDWVFDRHFLNGWTSRFPKASVRPFDDCGHFLLEDDPDGLIPLIREFVARSVPA